MSHTPFPWHARKDKDGWVTVYGPKDKIGWPTTVCTLPYYRNPVDRAIGEADGRLIEHIPSMLAILRALVDHEGERELSPIGTELRSDSLMQAMAQAESLIALAHTEPTDP